MFVLTHDIILICSDGLTNMVSEEQIHNIINKTKERLFYMRFTIKREELLKALNIASRAVSSKVVNPVLKNLKFETDIDFKPCANWLLKDNNLGKLLNGEFGKLKHKKSEKEIAEEEKTYAKEQLEQNELSEFEIKIKNISSREEFIEEIKKYYEDKVLQVICHKPLLHPAFLAGIQKFNITNSEVIELCQK